MTGLAALALVVWLYLAFGHGRFWQGGPVLSPTHPDHPPPAVIIVPARDEAATIGPVLLSLLAQDYRAPLQVVLVDDESTDGTGDIARALGDPRLTVIAGQPRPPGWSGKLWAVAQGIAVTDAPAVLLTDADIVHDSLHLATLVAQAERGGLDMVSEMVALRCVAPTERALVPAFVYFFQMLYPFARVNDTQYINAAAAAGGTVLIRRSALTRIGGIESIRDALIDDVTLAAAVKRIGRIWIGHSDQARSLREYPHPRDVWRMIARTAYVQLHRSPLLLTGTVLGLALVWIVPVVATIWGHGPSRLCGLAAWFIAAMTYWPTLRRFRLSPLWMPVLPAIAVFYMAATIGSAVDHHFGAGVAWKGRAYRGHGQGDGS